MAMKKVNEDRHKMGAYKRWSQGLATEEKHRSTAQALEDKNRKVFLVQPR